MNQKDIIRKLSSIPGEGRVIDFSEIKMGDWLMSIWIHKSATGRNIFGSYGKVGKFKNRYNRNCMGMEMYSLDGSRDEFHRDSYMELSKEEFERMDYLLYKLNHKEIDEVKALIMLRKLQQ